MLVSRRKYNLMYPLALLKGDMPPELITQMGDLGFFGILIPADAADTSLTITNLDGYPVSWTDGQLLGGVVYPIAGTAVTSAGSTTVTIFGA